MIRLYAQFDSILVRTGHQYRDLAKAFTAARSIAATLVEIRELTGQGTERLVGIIKDGTPIAL